LKQRQVSVYAPFLKTGPTGTAFGVSRKMRSGSPSAQDETRVGCHTKQSRDDRNRLHCADGPAAVFSDGYKIFSWHGTIVPEDVILHPEEITVERIDKETNIEIRRVLMDRYGLPRYLEDSGAEQIAEDELGVLLRKNVTGDEPIVMAKVLNATPEFDGTRKIYFLRVSSRHQNTARRYSVVVRNGGEGLSSGPRNVSALCRIIDLGKKSNSANFSS
jgi:hypothetical protein